MHLKYLKKVFLTFTLSFFLISSGEPFSILANQIPVDPIALESQDSLPQLSDTVPVDLSDTIVSNEGDTEADEVYSEDDKNNALSSDEKNSDEQSVSVEEISQELENRIENDIVSQPMTLVCTNTNGGRFRGKAGDTSVSINLKEDIISVDGIKGSDIIAYGIQFVGNPYKYAGTSLTDGCDCSGFVMAVLDHFGIFCPHPSNSIANYGTIIKDPEDARLGDVIVYNHGGHASFYMGDGKILESMDSANGIVAGKRTAFTNGNGSKKNFVIVRFLEEAPGPDGK